MSELSPEATMVIEWMEKWSPDDVTYAIENWVDIPKLIKKEFSNEIRFFRSVARNYVKVNPNKYRTFKRNVDSAVDEILEGLQLHLPEHARRILEGPPIVEMKAIGIQVKAPENPKTEASAPIAQKAFSYPDRGLEYVKFLLKGFRLMLYV